MKFVVHITETFSRDVLIDADDKFEAEEIAENLCNDSIININSEFDNFGDRTVEVIRKAVEADGDLIEYRRRR